MSADVGAGEEVGRGTSSAVGSCYRARTAIGYASSASPGSRVSVGACNAVAIRAAGVAVEVGSVVAGKASAR